MISAIEADEINRTFQDQLIPAARARGLTNRFILEHLRDGFCAGQPHYALVQTEPVWIVPILLAATLPAPIEVGEVIVQALRGDVIGFTPLAEVQKHARAASA